MNLLEKYTFIVTMSYMFQLKRKHHFRNNIFSVVVVSLYIYPLSDYFRSKYSKQMTLHYFLPFHLPHYNISIGRRMWIWEATKNENKYENNGGYDSFHTLDPLLEDTWTYFWWYIACYYNKVRIIVFTELFFFHRPCFLLFRFFYAFQSAICYNKKKLIFSSNA